MYDLYLVLRYTRRDEPLATSSTLTRRQLATPTAIILTISKDRPSLDPTLHPLVASILRKSSNRTLPRTPLGLLPQTPAGALPQTPPSYRPGPRRAPGATQQELSIRTFKMGVAGTIKIWQYHFFHTTFPYQSDFNQKSVYTTLIPGNGEHCGAQ